jgi:predicted glycoside hydrolase/deacetylase ChbG (UPF0249 family)
MAAKRYLIVNADDFGRSSGINRGIIEAHERGIVTSASLMVRWPAAGDAASYSRQHADLSIGLHLDLGEWAYRDNQWLSLYQVVPSNEVTAVAQEVSRQMSAFRELTGRDPTHIDSHQHAHLREPLRGILTQLADEVAVPLRGCSGQIHYCGDFYGQTADGLALPEMTTVEALTRILRGLSGRCTELSCHPAAENDIDTMYRTERLAEMKVLCDPRLRPALEAMNIELCSFRNLPAKQSAAS